MGVALAALALAFVGRRLAGDWDEVTDALGDARPAWIAGAFLLAVAGMTAIAVPWRRALRLLGGDLPWGDTVARYYLGELGKYLPGGVWPVVGRGELARRAGVPRAGAYGSVALSLAALYLAAVFLAVAGLPFLLAGGEGDGDGAGRYVWVAALLPVGVVALHHRVIARALGLGERVLHRRLDVDVPRWRQSLALVACYAPSWLLIGTATWAVARGLGADAGWLDVAPAAVVSWIVGFMLVPVPGGVGVREAVFVAAAASLDPGLAAAVALVARVLFVLSDALGALVASAWLARHRPAATDPGDAPGGEGAAAPGPAAATAGRAGAPTAL